MGKEREMTTVAILAFPETTASATYGLFDLFAGVGRDWAAMVGGRSSPPLMRPLVVARSKESFTASNGVPITPDTTLDACPPAAIICIPEVNISPAEPLDRRFDAEVAWIRERYQQGAILASACSGALLIAQTGLLDGYEATTHWAYCDLLARTHPQVKVVKGRPLVISGDEGRIVMAGGGVLWLDLGLHLIAHLIGVDEAMQAARVNLIDSHPPDLEPFAHLARATQVNDALIGECQRWIAERFHERSPVSAMVAFSRLPERSFKRRFQQATGMSPLEYVHGLRLEESKLMLERGDRSIEDVAFEVGYEDAGFFRRLFKRRVGVTPAEYRRRFGSMRRALES